MRVNGAATDSRWLLVVIRGRIANQDEAIDLGAVTSRDGGLITSSTRGARPCIGDQRPSKLAQLGRDPRVPLQGNDT